MRPSQLALMLSTALFAQAGAYAGEVTLFSGNDLTGREVHVRSAASTLRKLDFNDRTASLMVHSGVWEACTDADFRGECRVFDAGPHRNLDRFANQISSLREIEDNRGQGRERGNRRGRGREPSVMLFDGTDLRGRAYSLRGDTPDLWPLGFDNLTQSMEIRGGTWEFCEHKNFGGTCRVFEPGEYRNLDRISHRMISSARLIGDSRGQGGGQRDDYRQRDDQRDDYRQRDDYLQRDDAQRDDYRQRDDSAVELFAGPGLSGQRVAVRDEIRTLNQLNFNDRAGSLVIHSGEWEFCQHADFRGQCTVYGPGRYDRLGNLHNAISSVRRAR